MFKRVVVVGHTANPTGLERYLLDAARDLQVKAIGVPFYGPRLTTSRKVPRAVRASYWKQSSKRLAKQIRGLQLEGTDALLLVKCAGLLLDSRSIELVIGSAGRAATALVAPDALDTFCTEGRLRTLVAHGSFVATFDAEQEVEHWGTWLEPHLRTYGFGYSQFAHWHKVDPATAQRFRSAVFVGTWDKQREAVLQQLCHQIPVSVYGAYWQRAAAVAGLTIESTKPISGQQHATVVQRHALALNVVRSQNLKSGNMRTYETPAQGGLAASVCGAQQFTRGLWSSRVEDFVPLADAWMGKSRAARLREAVAAQAEIEPYTYSRRLGELLGAMSR